MTDDVAREQPAPTDAALPAPRLSIPRRLASWFSAQGVVAKFVVTIVTAVATALAVGVATRVAFDSGGGSGTLGAHEAPFTVSTSVEHGERFRMWVAQPLPDAGRWPPVGAGDTELVEFAHSLGGVDDTTWVRIVLDGTAGRTSTITNARAVVVDRAEPSPAAQLDFPAEGEEEVTGWSFHLDEPGAPAHELGDDPRAATPEAFAKHTVEVAPGETLTIDAIATTATCDCRWVIELDVAVDGTQRTVRVDDGGQPFHTSAGRPDVPVYAWAYFTGDGRFQVPHPDGTYSPVSS